MNYDPYTVVTVVTMSRVQWGRGVMNYDPYTVVTVVTMSRVQWGRGVMNYDPYTVVTMNVGEWGTFHDRNCSDNVEMYGS